VFNFFDEIKNKMGIKNDLLSDYTIVNISGKALYAEGHQGIITISTEKLVFKVKQCQMLVEGSGLILTELQEDTLLVQGRIDKITRV